MVYTCTVQPIYFLWFYYTLYSFLCQMRVGTPTPTRAHIIYIVGNPTRHIKKRDIYIYVYVCAYVRMRACVRVRTYTCMCGKTIRAHARVYVGIRGKINKKNKHTLRVCFRVSRYRVRCRVQCQFPGMHLYEI